MIDSFIDHFISLGYAITHWKVLKTMEILIDLLLVHFVLYIFSIIFILRSSTNDRSQKILQTVFSFVLVLAGPLITLAVHLSDLIKSEAPSDRYIGQSIDESPISWYWPFH